MGWVSFYPKSIFNPVSSQVRSVALLHCSKLAAVEEGGGGERKGSSTALLRKEKLFIFYYFTFICELRVY